jgi:hypothetical protein
VFASGTRERCRNRGLKLPAAELALASAPLRNHLHHLQREPRRHLNQPQKSLFVDGGKAAIDSSHRVGMVRESSSCTSPLHNTDRKRLIMNDLFGAAFGAAQTDSASICHPSVDGKRAEDKASALRLSGPDVLSCMRHVPQAVHIGPRRFIVPTADSRVYRRDPCADVAVAPATTEGGATCCIALATLSSTHAR